MAVLNKYKVGMDVYFSWDTFIGKAIRKLTKSRWSHIGIISEVNYKEGYVIIHEALFKGLVKNKYQIDNLLTLENKGLAYASMPKYPKGTLLKLVKDVCSSFEGESYGILQYPYILLFLFFEWLGFNNIVLKFLLTNRENKNTERYLDIKGIICSEFAARVKYIITKHKINYETKLDKPFDLITPEDCWRLRNHIW